MTTEIIPAARMILSKDELKSCKLIKKSELSDEKINHLKESQNIYKIASSEKKEILEEIKKLEAKNISYLYLDQLGLIAAGNSKIEADELVKNVLDDSFNSKQRPHAQVIDKGRVQNKIILITGAAQGFGKGIALELFAEGANIVIADLNENAGEELEEELNALNQSNKAFFIKTDVSNPESVEQLITKTVEEFGGLDVMISNAGVLRAGGLDEMDPSTFEFMTKVNYTGYFYCAKYASAVMKVQNEYNNEYFTDIIQINSKSGLKGSKKNFAYAGGKFGGLGLTQSFALELMPHKIKVNSVCPGNFFEGPLWADPEKGLFVQYLNAGKVPGAKTIEDVKKFYEEQVPAGRGCRVKDVARAILYSIEQEYETGQAIPVTGGQNMLR